MNSCSSSPGRRTACLALLFCTVAFASGPRATGSMQGRQALRVPALFIANRGQADPGVRFMVQTGDVRAWFRPAEIVMEWRKERARLSFPGANASPEIEGLNPAPATANFLLGPSASSWQTAVPIFRSILYREIYPGIDMVYGGSEHHLKSEFLVAPGADPGIIRLRYEGLGRPSLDAAGALVFRGGEDGLREEAPEVYQEVAGRRVHIDSKYRITEDDTVAFELGPYDEALPLIIDPVLAFSTYLGGTGFDCVNAVAVDPAGNAYVAGWTESADFPVAAARQSRPGGRVDAFVAKFSPSGALLYATYLGGSGEDRASGIAVDGAGSVTVAGWTYSTDFPVFSPAQPRLSGARDVFIARLNAAGTGFVYSTWLGGASNDSALAVALDQAGNTFVAVDTMSSNLPVRGALQGALRGRQDALLAKFAPAGQLLFCTYLGGAGADGATAVAVDLFGNPHLTGSTDSLDFPLQNPLQRQIGGGQDAFVTKVAADGGWLFYSTYLGGAGGTPGLPETGTGIAVDQQGNAYVTGTTSSSNFPTFAALRSAPAGGGLDAFVSKLNAAGGAFAYSTYLGGSSVDYGSALALDSAGTAYVTGYTASSNFPLAQAYQATHAGFYDVYLAALAQDGTLKFGTYLGGSGADSGSAVAVSGSGAVLVAGQSLSGNFPVRGAFQPLNPDNYGGFLTKFQVGGRPVVHSVTPSSGSGATQTFSFVVADPDGATDVVWEQVILNSTVSVMNACYFAYNRPQNFLSLAKDSSFETVGAVTVGGTGTVENSYCRLNAAGSSATVSGTTLTLNVSITFKAAFAGTKDIFVEATDTSGQGCGWTRVGSWTVAGGNRPPAIVSVSPASGGGSSNLFSFVFSDDDGVADLVWAQVIIGPSASLGGVCYFAYNRENNLLFLENDAGTGSTGTAAGGLGSLQNSQCTLYLADFKAVSAGNTLTITMPITFSPAFAGSKNVYLYASDRGGLGSGWQARGTWAVRPGTQPPIIQSVTPSSGLGTTQTFSFVVSDADGPAQLVWVHGLINTSIDPARACYFAYNPSHRLLFLENDAGTASTGTALGSSWILENSQCTVSPATSSAWLNGTTLTLNVAVTFKPTFTGAKNVYAYGMDIDGRGTGWQLRGVWTGTP